MAAIGGVLIGLACLFYGYCLVQLGRELMGSRNKMTCYGLSSTRSRDAALGLGAREKVVAMRAPRPVTPRGQAGSVGALSERFTYANTMLTLGKNRLTVLPSRTGRLAMKRAAKG